VNEYEGWVVVCVVSKLGALGRVNDHHHH